MEPRDVKLESDPVVFEVEQAGGQDGREIVIVIPPGIAGESDIVVAPQRWTAEVQGFRFQAGDAIVQRNSREGDEPIRVRIPVECRTGGEAAEGSEAETAITLTLTAGTATPLQLVVRLLASVNRVVPQWQALLEEYETLKPEWAEDLRAVRDSGGSDDDKLVAVYDVVHRRGREGDGLAAVCLSGGGIRSATFNLGTLQGMATLGLLPRFDYLSSVSGGGYIASWLSGWIQRAEKGREEVFAKLRNLQPGPVRPEPEPVVHLRQYSNFLTPRLGALSSDTWTAAAIIVRNMLLNWMVLVPLLAAVLALPLLFVGRPLPVEPPSPDLLFALALVFTGISMYAMSLLRASAKVPDGKKAQKALSTSQILAYGLLPLLTAVPLIVTAVAGFAARRAGDALDAWGVVVRCLIWSIGVPLVAFLASVPAQKKLMGRQRSYLPADVFALVLSGAIEAAIYIGILMSWLPAMLDSRWHLYEVFAPGLILGPLLLGKTLFLAFASLAEEMGYPPDLGDADREWWARWSGWVLLCTILWIALAALVIYGPLLLDAVWAKIAATVGAGGLGAVTSLLGKSFKTSAKEGQSSGQSWIMGLAVPGFCVLVLLLISVGTQILLRRLPVAWTGSAGAAPLPFHGYTPVLLGAILLLFGIGAIMGRFVNVNRFSLQAMYRNRIVRGYMGASNTNRRPNLFTGFDPDDNLRMHALRDNRPLPVVSIALNLVGGEELAWQQRKAESFTATPLHCGAGRLGYRRSQVYGGQHGISLGTAVATSGAAANPNMGYNSSPAIGFLMTLFNARLGAWLGNPGSPGASTYTRSGPRSSMLLLMAEALGFTDSSHPYVNLSDGGHFDNLGLYEMVRRRCRTIVVCDAGRDMKVEFEDLGNAIRKIRIDFGVPIEFDGDIHIYPKAEGKPPADAKYCALAKVRYSAVDGGGDDGTLVYIKPAICEGIPYDVYHYAKSSQAFPHEPTEDQWFSETQFESYRVLGKGAILQIAGQGPRTSPLDLGDFVDNIRSYLGPLPVVRPESLSAGVKELAAPGTPPLQK